MKCWTSWFVVIGLLSGAFHGGKKLIVSALIKDRNPPYRPSRLGYLRSLKHNSIANYYRDLHRPLVPRCVDQELPQRVRDATAIFTGTVRDMVDNNRAGTVRDLVDDNRAGTVRDMVDNNRAGTFRDMVDNNRARTVRDMVDDNRAGTVRDMVDNNRAGTVRDMVDDNRADETQTAIVEIKRVVKGEKIVDRFTSSPDQLNHKPSHHRRGRRMVAVTGLGMWTDLSLHQTNSTTDHHITDEDEEWWR